jgi:hypothetical protein
MAEVIVVASSLNAEDGPEYPLVDPISIRGQIKNSI